jgi:hypothetical protein
MSVLSCAQHMNLLVRGSMVVGLFLLATCDSPLQPRGSAGATTTSTVTRTMCLPCKFLWSLDVIHTPEADCLRFSSCAGRISPIAAAWSAGNLPPASSGSISPRISCVC